jgi:lipopolysaccharide/colanic/teichoic acid biosynthesis glycosyltransferase
VLLVDIDTPLRASWQNNIKRFIDVVASLTGMVIFSPLLLYAALRTKFSSEGSIIYRQERTGFKGRLFYIHKFRSMYVDAEKTGRHYHQKMIRALRRGEK